MNNFIINCGADQIEQCSKEVEALGYAPGYYKRGGDALKVYSEEDQKRKYCVGYLDKYMSYIKYQEAYKDFVVTTWEEFQKLTSIKQITTKPIIEEAPVFGRNTSIRPSLAEIMAAQRTEKHPVEDKRKALVIYADQVVKYYKNAPSDHQSLLKALFGAELFKEKVYKLGMQFSYGNTGEDIYRLISPVSKSVQLVNVKDHKSFGLIKLVNDVDTGVTEEEMKSWLTYHWEKFKLIEE